MLAAGIDAIPSDVQAIVMRRVATFSDLTPENDPRGALDRVGRCVASHRISRIAESNPVQSRNVILRKAPRTVIRAQVVTATWVASAYYV